MSTSYILRLIKEALNHNLKFVYMDLAIRLVLNFYIFTLITVKVNSNIFSLYAFAILSSSLIVQVINGSTEIAINKNLLKNTNFLNYFLYKIFLALILFTPIFFITKFSIYTLIVCVSSLIGLVGEHLELKLRYNYDYEIYFYKILIQFFCFLFKYKFIIDGGVILVLLISMIEVFIVSSLGFLFLKKYFYGNNDNLKYFLIREKSALLKYTASGFLIFLFFKLDQIYVYFKLNSHVFSTYFIASRFNEILNTMVAVWARYSIPKLFKEDNIEVFRKVILKNIIAHILISILIFFVVLFYTIFLNPQYSAIVYIYTILSVSGLFLVFGQVRGIYFVKNDYIIPDILNAIIGILVFISSLWLFELLFNSFYVIPLAYLFGFMFSGFLTTFLYKLGRDFIFKLFFLGRKYD
ncbi:MAG TPA: hypothetical protein PLX05_02815 [Acinetobacter parvus]|uniref:hypothetical protein n=1 Tax=Acinetobacter parvus TaxID=134533 RepID=UPI002BA3DB28|nr:hypothetical protein [Acinetobacter parvus]HRM14571.1 hypothetical protein [Acinetobacter parvus]